MFTPDTPRGMDAADRTLAAIESLEPRDQLAGLGWAVVSVLGALKPRFEKTPAKRDALMRCAAKRRPGSAEDRGVRFIKAH